MEGGSARQAWVGCGALFNERSISCLFQASLLIGHILAPNSRGLNVRGLASKRGLLQI